MRRRCNSRGRQLLFYYSSETRCGEHQRQNGRSGWGRGCCKLIGLSWPAPEAGCSTRPHRRHCPDTSGPQTL